MDPRYPLPMAIGGSGLTGRMLCAGQPGRIAGYRAAGGIPLTRRYGAGTEAVGAAAMGRAGGAAHFRAGPRELRFIPAAIQAAPVVADTDQG